MSSLRKKKNEMPSGAALAGADLTCVYSLSVFGYPQPVKLGRMRTVLIRAY